MNERVLKIDAKMNTFANGGTRFPPLPLLPLKCKNPNLIFDYSRITANSYTDLLESYDLQKHSPIENSLRYFLERSAERDPPPSKVDNFCLSQKMQNF